MELVAGKRYEIQVDSSKQYLMMQYSFKPARIDDAQPGVLSLADPNAISTEASLKLTTLSTSSSSASSSSASPGANADYITLNGTSSISPTTDRVLVYDPSTDSLRMHRIGQSITGLKRRRDHFDDVEVEDSSHPRHQKRKLNKLINKGKKKKVRKDKNEQPKEDNRNDDNDIGNGDDADEDSNGEVRRGRKRRMKIIGTTKK